MNQTTMLSETRSKLLELNAMLEKEAPKFVVGYYQMVYPPSAVPACFLYYRPTSNKQFDFPLMRLDEGFQVEDVCKIAKKFNEFYDMAFAQGQKAKSLQIQEVLGIHRCTHNMRF